MAHKVSRKYALDIKGIIDVENNRVTISVEDRGEFDLANMLQDFSGRECSISVKYDEEYTGPEVNEETGEVIE